MLTIFRSSITVLFAFLVLSIPRYSTAELQSIDDPVYGFGSITYDTETGLEWLDLTYTVNLSYDEVSDQIEQGGDYEGFTRPTYAEVSDLFYHAGILLDPNGEAVISDSEGMEACQLLADLLGPTSWQVGWPEVFGTWGESSPLGTVEYAQVDFSWGESPAGEYQLDLGGAWVATGDHDPIIAHFLVRSSPPAPDLEILREALPGWVQNHGILVSLESKLSAASQALNDLKGSNDGAAINNLQAFINAVEAQWGKHIPEADAEALIEAAQSIIDMLSLQ